MPLCGHHALSLFLVLDCVATSPFLACKGTPASPREDALLLRGAPHRRFYVETCIISFQSWLCVPVYCPYVSVQYLHVPAYQDDYKAYHMLLRLAQLNWLYNGMAKEVK